MAEFEIESANTYDTIFSPFNVEEQSVSQLPAIPTDYIVNQTKNLKKDNNCKNQKPKNVTFDNTENNTQKTPENDILEAFTTEKTPEKEKYSFDLFSDILPFLIAILLIVFAIYKQYY